MRIGDKQLLGVGRPELTAEWPKPLGVEGRARSLGQKPITPNDKTVDLRCCHAGPDQAGTRRVEENIARLRAIRKRNSRVGQRLDLPRGGQNEAAVVRVHTNHTTDVGADIGDVDETIVLGEANRSRTARGDHSFRHQLQATIDVYS